MRINVLALFLCSLIMVSCHQPVKEGVIEVISNLNVSEEPLQEALIYKNVKIVKLETTPSSLLGNINRIEMNDSLIFVLEYGKLSIFTLDGKFISQVWQKRRRTG